MPPVDEEQSASNAADAPAASDVSAVYARFARPLFRFILHRVGDRSVAEDLLHDVFVRMLVGLPQYEERGYSVSAWLYRIAACRVIDWLRVNGRRRTTALEQARKLVGEAWPDGERTAADGEAEQRILLAALAQLTESQAAVIRLRFMAELPIAEVAERLSLTPQAVKALQHRGMAQLRLLLARPSSYHPAEAA